MFRRASFDDRVEKDSVECIFFDNSHPVVIDPKSEGRKVCVTTGGTMHGKAWNDTFVGNTEVDANLPPIPPAATLPLPRDTSTGSSVTVLSSSPSVSSMASVASASVASSSASSFLFRGRGMPRSAQRSLTDPVGAAASSLARLEAFLHREDSQADLSAQGDRDDDSIQEELRRLRESEEGMRNELEGLWLAGAVGGWKNDDNCSDEEDEEEHEGVEFKDGGHCQFCDDDHTLRLDPELLDHAAPITSTYADAAAAAGGLSLISRRRGSGSSALDLAGLGEYEARLQNKLRNVLLGDTSSDPMDLVSLASSTNLVSDQVSLASSTGVGMDLSTTFGHEINDEVDEVEVTPQQRGDGRLSSTGGFLPISNECTWRHCEGPTTVQSKCTDECPGKQDSHGDCDNCKRVACDMPVSSGATDEALSDSQCQYKKDEDDLDSSIQSIGSIHSAPFLLHGPQSTSSLPLLMSSLLSSSSQRGGRSTNTRHLPPSPLSTEGSLSSLTIHGMDIFSSCVLPPLPVLAGVCEDKPMPDMMINREVEFVNNSEFKTSPRQQGEMGIFSFLLGLLLQSERMAEMLYGQRDGGMAIGKGGWTVEPRLLLAVGLATLVSVAEHSFVP